MLTAVASLSSLLHSNVTTLKGVCIHAIKRIYSPKLYYINLLDPSKMPSLNEVPIKISVNLSLIDRNLTLDAPMQNKLSLPLKIDIQSMPPSSDELSQLQLQLKSIRKRKILEVVISFVVILFTAFVLAFIFDDLRYISINMIGLFYTLYLSQKAKPIENQLDSLQPLSQLEHPRKYVKLAQHADDPVVKHYLTQIAVLNRQPTLLEFNAVEEWLSKADIREAEKRFEALKPSSV